MHCLSSQISHLQYHSPRVCIFTKALKIFLLRPFFWANLRISYRRMLFVCQKQFQSPSLRQNAKQEPLAWFLHSLTIIILLRRIHPLLRCRKGHHRINRRFLLLRKLLLLQSLPLQHTLHLPL